MSWQFEVRFFQLLFLQFFRYDFSIMSLDFRLDSEHRKGQKFTYGHTYRMDVFPDSSTISSRGMTRASPMFPREIDEAPEIGPFGTCCIIWYYISPQTMRTVPRQFTRPSRPSDTHMISQLSNGTPSALILREPR